MKIRRIHGPSRSWRGKLVYRAAVSRKDFGTILVSRRWHTWRCGDSSSGPRFCKTRMTAWLRSRCQSVMVRRLRSIARSSVTSIRLPRTFGGNEKSFTQSREDDAKTQGRINLFASLLNSRLCVKGLCASACAGCPSASRSRTRRCSRCSGSRVRQTGRSTGAVIVVLLDSQTILDVCHA